MLDQEQRDAHVVADGLRDTEDVVLVEQVAVGELFSHWEGYALAVAGVLGFVLQQVSLGTGRLAPSVATVSVANPVVGILLGTILLQERLSRPAWHVAVACIGLGLALAGAVVISIAREVATESPEPAPATA